MSKKSIEISRPQNYVYKCTSPYFPFNEAKYPHDKRLQNVRSSDNLQRKSKTPDAVQLFILMQNQKKEHFNDEEYMNDDMFLELISMQQTASMFRQANNYSLGDALYARFNTMNSAPRSSSIFGPGSNRVNQFHGLGIGQWKHGQGIAGMFEPGPEKYKQSQGTGGIFTQNYKYMHEMQDMYKMRDSYGMVGSVGIKSQYVMKDGNHGMPGPFRTADSHGTAGQNRATDPHGTTGPYGTSGIHITAGSYGTTGPYGSAGTHITTGLYGPTGPYGTAGTHITAGSYGTTGPYRTAGTHTTAGSYETTYPYGVAGTHGPASPYRAAGLHETTGPYRTKDPFRTAGTHGKAASYETTGPYGTASTHGTAGPYRASGLHETTGFHGSTGPYGKEGAHVATGPNEKVGPHGTAGSYGTTGPYGITGPYGTAGPNRTAGSHGITGPYGTASTYGTAGPYGTAGSYGTAGPHGTAGPYGMAGTHGTAGPYRAVGLHETTGHHGRQGLYGTADPHGAADQYGTTGPYGTAGTHEIPGPYRAVGLHETTGPLGTTDPYETAGPLGIKSHNGTADYHEMKGPNVIKNAHGNKTFTATQDRGEGFHAGTGNDNRRNEAKHKNGKIKQDGVLNQNTVSEIYTKSVKKDKAVDPLYLRKKGKEYQQHLKEVINATKYKRISTDFLHLLENNNANQRQHMGRLSEEDNIVAMDLDNLNEMIRNLKNGSGLTPEQLYYLTEFMTKGGMLPEELSNAISPEMKDYLNKSVDARNLLKPDYSTTINKKDLPRSSRRKSFASGAKVDWRYYGLNRLAYYEPVYLKFKDETNMDLNKPIIKNMKLKRISKVIQHLHSLQHHNHRTTK